MSVAALIILMRVASLFALLFVSLKAHDQRDAISSSEVTVHVTYTTTVSVIPFGIKSGWTLRYTIRALDRFLNAILTPLSSFIHRTSP